MKQIKKQIPFFNKYPELIESIPYINLGTLPTPVISLKNFADKISASNFYIKRDDISGLEYGGNKVRKLEFILAEALLLKYKSVITFGFAGSNHAAATAAYANKCGLKPILILLEQHDADYVRKNILSNLRNNAEMHFCKNGRSSRIKTAIYSFISRFRYGTKPYIIPVGGSSPLGIIGFINAVMELKQQILDGFLEEPDYIYVPAGSLGTMAGLIIGKKLTGIKSKIIGIRVVEERFADKSKLLFLINQTMNYIKEKSNIFPSITLTDDDFNMDGSFFEPGYGIPTEQINMAIASAKEIGAILDITYSGKAFAALIKHAEEDLFKGKNVLFWNTYSSVNL